MRLTNMDQWKPPLAGDQEVNGDLYSGLVTGIW
jgi:hypothetical protein